MTNDHDLEGDERLFQARCGSHAAFRALVEPYEAELQRHCYRMTGSVDDADDLVQETLFRAWRGLGTYVSRGSFRAWLYQIATRRTLDLLKSSARRNEVVNSANEPAWLQPYPFEVETSEADSAVIRLEEIGLAFIVALQNLPGRPRAALILRDVLGFSAKETAAILGCSVPAANSALQRARSKMAAIHPIDPPAVTDVDQAHVAAQLVDAWRSADIDALIGLLHETVHMTMPPDRMEFFGAFDTAGFLASVATTNGGREPHLEPITANGQHGAALYLFDEAEALHKRHCLLLVESEGPTIRKITGFAEDRIFDLLDLPRTISATSLDLDGGALEPTDDDAENGG